MESKVRMHEELCGTIHLNLRTCSSSTFCEFHDTVVHDLVRTRTDEERGQSMQWQQKRTERLQIALLLMLVTNVLDEHGHNFFAEYDI